MTAIKDRLPRRIVDHAMERPVLALPDEPWSPPPAPPTTPVRLYIGPANFAGQAWALARSVEAANADVRAVTFCPSDTGFGFDTDYTVANATYLEDEAWQKLMYGYLTENFSHVIIEAARPLLGRYLGRRIAKEAAALRAQGIAVATLAHGTDIRVPSEHAARYSYSPFTGDLIPEQALLEQRAQRNLIYLRAMDAEHFVTTPDLLEFLPEATWCPVVVNPLRWRQERPIFDGGNSPVVVHAPSKSAVKGSDIVDPLLQAATNLEYRRLSGIPAAEMPSHFADADIVLDQFRLGSYGVAACEAMAAGRLVIGNVNDQVRTAVRDACGLDLPIVQSDGHDVLAVIDDLLADRDRAAELAAAGPDFVNRLHSGSYSAQVLAPFLESHR